MRRSLDFVQDGTDLSPRKLVLCPPPLTLDSENRFGWQAEPFSPLNPGGESRMRPPLSMPTWRVDEFRDSYSAENGGTLRGSPTRVSPRWVPDGLRDIPECTEAVGGTGQASSLASDLRGQCSYFGRSGLMDSFGWAVGCPDHWLNIILGVSVRAFLEDTFELVD